MINWIKNCYRRYVLGYIPLNEAIEIIETPKGLKKINCPADMGFLAVFKNLIPLIRRKIFHRITFDEAAEIFERETGNFGIEYCKSLNFWTPSPYNVKRVIMNLIYNECSANNYSLEFILFRKSDQILGCWSIHEKHLEEIVKKYKAIVDEWKDENTK